MPPIKNDTQTAAPAMVPASPNKAKIPAPTIEPMPRNTAPNKDIFPFFVVLSVLCSVSVIIAPKH
jgi:hypothetical protein